MSRHEQDLIVVESQERGSVVRLLSESLLDPLQVGAVHQQLKKALATSEPPNLVLALDTVSVMSSVMLSVLVSLQEDAKRVGGHVCLAAPGERITELLRVTRLEEVFGVHATVAEALASLT